MKTLLNVKGSYIRLRMELVPGLSCLIILLIKMNSLIWNCRGAGGQIFASMIRDFLSIYQLAFVAILEPRISSSTADKVIRKIGLYEGAIVEARGFSGDIWCWWRSNFMPVNVASSSRYCIHLKMNPNSPSFWFIFPCHLCKPKC